MIYCKQYANQGSTVLSLIEVTTNKLDVLAVSDHSNSKCIINQSAVFLMVVFCFPFNFARFTEPSVSCGFSSGSGALWGVRHQLHPSPRTHLHLGHTGTHLAAGWYDSDTHDFNTIFQIGFQIHSVNRECFDTLVVDAESDKYYVCP